MLGYATQSACKVKSQNHVLGLSHHKMSFGMQSPWVVKLFHCDLTPINLLFSCLGLSLKPGCYPKFPMKANSPGEGRSSPCPVPLGILLCPEACEPNGFAWKRQKYFTAH